MQTSFVYNVTIHLLLMLYYKKFDQYNNNLGMLLIKISLCYITYLLNLVEDLRIE